MKRIEKRIILALHNDTIIMSGVVPLEQVATMKEAITAKDLTAKVLPYPRMTGEQMLDALMAATL